jgi:hypothetical protein
MVTQPELVLNCFLARPKMKKLKIFIWVKHELASLKQIGYKIKYKKEGSVKGIGYIATIYRKHPV